MANKSLKGKKWNVPAEILKSMQDTLKSFDGDKTTSGYARAKGIIDKQKMSYEQLKRVKNFFDTYDKQDVVYELNGGDLLKKWVNEILSNNRESIYMGKKIRMDAGMENQFIKKHTKDRSKNPTKTRTPKVASKSKYIMQNKAVYEELQGIRDLINKLIK